MTYTPQDTRTVSTPSQLATAQPLIRWLKPRGAFPSWKLPGPSGT